MYNLMVSGNDASWEGDPFLIEASRCINQYEYTDPELSKRFVGLDANAVAELQQLPCLFAYESVLRKPPELGLIRKITKLPGKVRIEYDIKTPQPFLTADQVATMATALHIDDPFELHRTHWAIKDVNLAKVLSTRGMTLPSWALRAPILVDINTHQFEVALSFPGEARPLVQSVAQELEERLGQNSYFYDDNYLSQLFRPSLDTLLQGIYGNRARLVVVFLSGDYQRKEWCGVEFRAIREIIMRREHNKVMFVRLDDGNVEGIFKTDLGVDARKFTPEDIAYFIVERVELLRNAEQQI